MEKLKINPFKKEVILGTVQMGIAYGIKNAGNPNHKMTEAIALELLQFALENGVYTFDTARDYGIAENILGQWPNRIQAKILTKIKGAKSLTEAEDLFAKSLQALRLERIHCLSLHLFEECKLDFNLKLLENLKKSGLIEKTGISLYTIEQIEHVVHHTDIEVIQSPFNLLDHWGTRGPSFSRAKASNRILHVRSLFLQGLILMNPNTIPPALHAILPSLNVLNEIAMEAGITLSELCLRYALSIPHIDGVIIGVDQLTDLKQNLDSMKKNVLPDTIKKRVEEIRVSDPRILDPSLWSKL